VERWRKGAYLLMRLVYNEDNREGSNDPGSLGIIICAGRGSKSIERQLVK